MTTAEGELGLNGPGVSELATQSNPQERVLVLAATIFTTDGDGHIVLNQQTATVLTDKRLSASLKQAVAIKALELELAKTDLDQSALKLLAKAARDLLTLVDYQLAEYASFGMMLADLDGFAELAPHLPVKLLSELGRPDLETCDPKRAAQYLRQVLDSRVTISPQALLSKCEPVTPALFERIEDASDDVLSIDLLAKELLNEDQELPEYIADALGMLAQHGDDLARLLLEQYVRKRILNPAFLSGIQADYSDPAVGHYDPREWSTNQDELLEGDDPANPIFRLGVTLRIISRV